MTYHIRPKPYVPPKVKRDFWPKTETESQSTVSEPTRLQKPASPAQCPLPNYLVHLISFILSPIMSAVRRVINDTATRPHSTRCRCRQHSRFLGIVYLYTVRLMTPRVWPLQLKLCDLLLATAEFTNCSPLKPKVQRM